MPDFGITPTGFVTKRLDQILADIQAEMKTIYGDNLNLEPESPDGQITAIIAAAYADLWEIGNQSYNALNPDAALDAALSNIVTYNGLFRKDESQSTVTLTVDGVDTTFIPTGSLVSTSDTGASFITTADVTLTAGVDTVTAESEDFGPILAVAGTITVIDSPVTGWTSVTNAADAIPGTLIENNVVLRARRERSLGIEAQSVIDSLFAGLSNLENVVSVAVLENDTNAVDANGLPAHSFLSLVQGGLL